MRILHTPVASTTLDVDWSFKIMQTGSGLLFVLCCSMLVAHTSQPPKRLFDDRRTAHRAAPCKPAADLLINARAWARPGIGGTAPGVRVAAELGCWRKELAVFGDRVWLATALGMTATRPLLFESMPITYDRAFGGMDYRANPIGLGWGPGERGRRLPNIERMDQRVMQPTSQPEPGGFGPIDPFWQPRIGKLGTFDNAWLERCWPGLPANADPSFWNEAPADQQFHRPFRGDERLAFENLDPQHEMFELCLPGRRARAFVEMAEHEFRELELALDTIDVDLEMAQTELVWRGAMRITSPRLREIGFLFTLVEQLAKPSSLADCHARFAAMRRAQYPTDDERKADQEAARAAREAAQAESDAAAKTQSVETEALIAEVRQRVDALLNKSGRSGGIDALPKSEPPTDFVAAAARGLAALRKRNLPQADEAEAGLRQVQAMLPMPESAWTRERVIEAHAADADMSDADLSGLDLSGLELTHARLSRAKLTKANLLGASLAGADVSGADFTGTDATNLDLQDANLAGARFTDATVIGARLTGANLTRTKFAGVKAGGLNFDRCQGEAADFRDAALAGSSFQQAHLPGSIFTGANLNRARFDGALLHAADFGDVLGETASFVDADLTNLRARRRARFTRCKAPVSVFQQAKLAHADFSQATLHRGNFAEADMTEARLDRAILSSACFDDAILCRAVVTNAKLLRASFERAELENANFAGSNLYQAGLFGARAGGTDFTGCFLAGTLLAQ
jgi:uncharacterized protein YjbI with pentapeptide repeats